MSREAHGWWTAPRLMCDGDNYGYLVDDDGPFPDPRSACQPAGVHGLSRVVNHAAFEWTDQAWQPPPLAAAVIYELHVGTFTPAGSFESAIERMDHLARLGVTHVELMPVAEFPGARGWGYDGVDLFAPHHLYGGPDGLKRLVDGCHQRGLAVILDVVYNHFGPAGNYLSRFGPYFTPRYHTPWGDAVNLDGADSGEVRRFICDNALMWLREYHFDGLRLDAVHALIDASATHLLEQLSREVDILEAALGRHLLLIAESDLNDPRIVRSPDLGGYGIDAQWSDDFHHAVHSLLTGERSGYYEDFGGMDEVARALGDVFVYAGRYSRHRGRVHGRAPVGLSGSNFVVSIQNHDQIGNRALGERLTGLVPESRLRIAAALLLTAPFIPLLFQGEEWGATTPFQYFTAHEDEELGRLVSEGRRREFAAFGWDAATIPDPQAPGTFHRCLLDWNELPERPHAGILEWYRALIKLRRTRSSLRDGDYQHLKVVCDEAHQWLSVQRQEIVLVCNLAGQSAGFTLAGEALVLIASTTGGSITDGVLSVPAHSVVILESPDGHVTFEDRPAS